jgi:hypothetical protein
MKDQLQQRRIKNSNGILVKMPFFLMILVVEKTVGLINIPAKSMMFLRGRPLAFRMTQVSRLVAG